MESQPYNILFWKHQKTVFLKQTRLPWAPSSCQTVSYPPFNREKLFSNRQV